MSHSSMVSRTFDHFRVFGAAKKIRAKVWELLRKIKKKLKVTALFCQENKNSNVDNFFQELDKNPPTSS